MARTNLASNPSFRQGLVGYSSVSGATLSIASGRAFYGNESIKVVKDAQNSSGFQTMFIPVTAGLDYAYSMYVQVPITVPATEEANIVLTVSWYKYDGTFISDSSSVILTLDPSSSWSRLTGVDTAPPLATKAMLSVTQLAAGTAGQVFYADALLFEQSSFVGGYLDNVTQADETRILNQGLSEYPAPTIGGLPLDADISLGDFVFNTIDEFNVVWVCTDIDGWYGPADPETTDIPRGVEDGSYDVSGRTQARVITLSGTMLLPDPSMLGAARDRLVQATNLVRKGAWLRTNESPTRAAFVRLSGKVQIQTVNARGRTDFQIGLKAADPIRYEWNDEDPDGLTDVEITVAPDAQRRNLALDPAFYTTNGHDARWFGGSGGNGSYVPAVTDSKISRSWSGTVGNSNSIEVSYGRTRFNQAVNPAFDSGNTTSWGPNSSNSTGTLAAVTTMPHSGTYSMRVTGGTGQNEGAYTVFTASGSMNYTASAWVYIPSSNGMLTVTPAIGFSGGFVAGSVITLRDQWVRVSVTGQAPAANGSASFYLYDGTSAANANNGRIMYVDDVLIESSLFMDPYFDGNTPSVVSTGIGPAPVTSVWTGVAGQSVSGKYVAGRPYRRNLCIQPKGSFPNGVANSTSATGQADTRFPSGLASVNTFTSSGSTVSINTLQVTSVVPNKLYTVSFYVAATFNMSGNVTAKTVDVNGNDLNYHNDPVIWTVPAGQATRVSMTFKTDSGAAGVDLFFGATTGNYVTGDKVYTSSFLIEQSATLRSYFDGDTAASVLNSGPTDQGGPASYVRKFWTVPNGDHSQSLPGVNGDTGIQSAQSALKPNTTYTWSGWLRTNATGKYYFARSYVTNTDQTVIIQDNTSYGYVALQPDTWTRASVTFTTPAGTGGVIPILDVNGVGTLGWDSGDWLDATGGLLEQTDTLKDYFDGFTASTDSYIYFWDGIENASSSERIGSSLVVGNVENIGTSDVTGVFNLQGPLGSGSTIYNATTDQTITTTDPLRAAGPVATVINKELTNGIVTLTTGAPHGLVEGDEIIVSGVGSPFDAVNETLTVTGVTDLAPYTINYLRTWPDIDSSGSSGQIKLANADVLSLDTYNRSVTFNGSILGNRSRVETLIDWIKLAPGENIIQLTDNPEQIQIDSKSLTSNVVTLTSDDAHFFVPGEQVYVSLPTTADLAIKSLTSNVITLTTAEDHGFSVGDSINVNSTAISNVVNKAITSNTALLTTDVLGAFNVGDSIVVTLPSSATIIAKGSTSNTVTLTTATAHGFSIGDTVNTVFPSTSVIANKAHSGGLATLTTASAHGFSVGDPVAVVLPTTTNVTNKYTNGQSIILSTANAHGFSLNDKILVAFPVTATTTTSRTYDGTSTYLTTITTTAAHGFGVNDKVSVDGTTRVIQSVPSTTTFTYLDYTQTTAGTVTVSASTVTNLTNQTINGNGPVTIASIPSTTQFSYSV